jgi:flagellar basal body-associated protein FliL
MSDTTAQPKKKRKMLTSFSIIFILLALVAIISILLNGTSFHYEDIQGTVTGATLGSFTMASVNGFKDAVDVCLFVMVLGGFLGIVNKTDALATGIDVLVAKMNGNELKLIPILMAIFAFGGTTYGMCEETVGFYALLSATMIAAGYDSLSGAMIVLLGAGVGCLGSTVNPFATGIASSALTDMGIKVNQAVVIGLGLVLLVVSYAIAVFFVLQYAKRVKADPSKSLMSQDEIDASLASYANDSDSSQKKSLTGKQKGVLWVFAAAFIIMVISFVPWEDLGVNAFVAGSSSHDETSTVTAADIEQQYSDDEPRHAEARQERQGQAHHHRHRQRRLVRVPDGHPARPVVLRRVHHLVPAPRHPHRHHRRPVRARDRRHVHGGRRRHDVRRHDHRGLPWRLRPHEEHGPCEPGPRELRERP